MTSIPVRQGDLGEDVEKEISCGNSGQLPEQEEEEEKKSTSWTKREKKKHRTK